MPLNLQKEHFLANENTKQRFIDALNNKLQHNGVHTLHAQGDADLLTAKTAAESSSSIQPTTLIGDDTDLLVLLCFHADVTRNGLYFRSEGKQTTKTLRVWYIVWLKSKLDPELLPFVHAFSGCDTTSRLFGIGKG